MTINPQIKEILNDYKIGYNDGVTYLLAVFHGLDPSYVPDILKRQVAATNIFTKLAKGSVDWRVNLFEGTLDEYAWVKDYVKVFKNLNPSVPGSVAECTRRFRVFFAKHPQYTVEDVKGALNLYIQSLSDPKFIGYPHYFISKDGTSLLEMWLETYVEGNQSKGERVSRTNTMQ